MGPPEMWEVEQLLSAESDALVWGEVDWVAQQGRTVEARLSIYGNSVNGEGEVVLRAKELAPEAFHATVVLRGIAVGRGCWNSPHRDEGVLYDLPAHGHVFGNGSRLIYDPAPPLDKITSDGQVRPWEYRVAVQSFLEWCCLEHSALDWVDPWEGGAP